MIVRGNTVGTTVPRPDYAETNPESPRYIFNKPDGAIQKAQQTADAALPKGGGTLSGELNMEGNAILNLPEPTLAAHPATKTYVDTALSGLHFTARLTLPAASWAGSGPYTQQVSLPGIRDTDCPHYGPVYGEAWAGEKEAFALVDKLETREGTLVFTCYAERPETNLTIQLEVNR